MNVGWGATRRGRSNASSVRIWLARGVGLSQARLAPSVRRGRRRRTGTSECPLRLSALGTGGLVPLGLMATGPHVLHQQRREPCVHGQGSLARGVCVEVRRASVCTCPHQCPHPFPHPCFDFKCSKSKASPQQRHGSRNHSFQCRHPHGKASSTPAGIGGVGYRRVSMWVRRVLRDVPLKSLVGVFETGGTVKFQDNGYPRVTLLNVTVCIDCGRKVRDDSVWRDTPFSTKCSPCHDRRQHGRIPVLDRMCRRLARMTCCCRRVRSHDVMCVVGIRCFFRDWMADLRHNSYTFVAFVQ